VEVLGVESVSADTVVLRVQAKTMPSKAQLVTRALRARLKAAFDGAGIKLKEEPAAPAAAAASPAVADAQPPSALADPASARSLGSRPIPPPSPEEQQAFSKLP
jgi:small conductance mechanosensitive channel